MEQKVSLVHSEKNSTFNYYNEQFYNIVNIKRIPFYLQKFSILIYFILIVIF
jgi:hypothetical protein